MSRKTRTVTRRLVISAMCLAMCQLLPFVTGQIPKLGNALCPMHIPVLLCGFLCGASWGAVVGFIAPLLRSAVFHVPVLIPMGIVMALELATYGAVSGALSRRLPMRVGYIYACLIPAMLAGRAVWGVGRFLFGLLIGEKFTLAMFLAGAFFTAIPGIVCQLVLIPPLVLALKRRR